MDRNAADPAFERIATQVLREVNDAPDAGAALASIGRSAVHHTGCELVSLEAPADDGSVQVARTYGTEAWRRPRGTPVPTADDEPVLVAYRSGSAYVRRHASAAAAGRSDRHLYRCGFGSHVSVPVRTAGQLRASVTFAWLSDDAFDAEDVTLLESLVQICSGTLSSLLLLEQDERAIQRLGRMNAMRRKLVSAVAHDLRNPLGVILGFAEALQTHRDRLDEDERALFARRITANARTLSEMTENLLSALQIDEDLAPVSTREVDVGELAAEVVSDTRVQHPHRAITIDLEDPSPTAVANASDLRRVITNLLSNAVKYTPDDTPIEVTVESQPAEVHVAVRDHGPGVPPEDVALIFRPFSRAHDDNVPGTGLGLFVCKRLVERVGGRIWVDAGAGATFHVCLPRPGEDAASPTVIDLGNGP